MIEQAMQELTGALERNSNLLEGLTSKAASNSKATAKSAPEDDAKSDDEPKTKAAPKAKAPAKEKTPTKPQMKEVATGYLDVEDEDEYADRREIVRAVTDHFGAEKFTEIDTKDRLMAKKVIEMAQAGENVDPEDIEAAVESLSGEEAPKKSPRDDDDI